MNKCKICNQLIADPIAEIGSKTPYEAQIMMALVMHLTTQHPRDDQHLQLSGMSHLGISRMSFFEISNPELKARLDRSRWEMLQAYIQPPDEAEIEAFAVELLAMAGRENNQGNRAKVCGFLNQVVNRCYEADKYPPEQPHKPN